VPRADQIPLFANAPLPQAPLDDAQRLACLRLIRSEQVGPVTFRELINQFGGADVALEVLPELVRRGGGKRTIRICPRDVAAAELAAAAKAGARPLFTIEPGYPAALAHVDVPPPLLYVKGNADLLARPAVGVVGSRNASAAGQRFTRQIAAALGAEGLAVVSGLARGIDAAAHEAALATGTVAVVAGGIDVVYPPEHEALQRQIGESGCLVTEQPPGYVPRAQDFPRRNRIISGMSLGVLIVEAARRSGTLITARTAGEQGREVMAVPGHPLDPRAEGTNQLLRDGATLVTRASDVIEALGPVLKTRGVERPVGLRDDANPLPSRSGSDAPLTEDARIAVLAALGPAPASVDEVARATHLDIRSVRIALLELALAGRIEQHGGQLVSLRQG
jgi:DNA processing protein